MKTIYKNICTSLSVTHTEDKSISLRYVFCFFIFLIVSVLFLFRNVFSIDFFSDDFFFLAIGHVKNVGDLLGFFSPFKSYFYRPIPTELFYSIVNLFNQSYFIAHVIVFVTYSIGLIFLYKVSKLLTRSFFFSALFTFMYAINFIHVFQLYWLATFQEVTMFTFLSITTYFFLQKRLFISYLFYIFALMSKETAILYPIFLFVYIFFWESGLQLKKYKKIVIPLIISLVFLVIYHQSSLNVVETADTYTLRLDPRLIINNTVWYYLWSFGLPNFLPDYVKSILFNPLPSFWNLMTSNDIRTYLYLLIGFYTLFIPTAIVTFLRLVKINKYAFITLFILSCLFSFLFVSPTLFIIHRWMVRLTLPLLFIIAFQAYVLFLSWKQKGYLRLVSIVIVCLYIYLQVLGVRIHESSSLFTLDSQIVKSSRAYFALHTNQIAQSDTVYFTDKEKTALPGSMDLKNILDDQRFIPVLLPGSSIKKAVYQFESPVIPNGSYIVKSEDILGKISNY